MQHTGAFQRVEKVSDLGGRPLLSCLFFWGELAMYPVRCLKAMRFAARSFRYGYLNLAASHSMAQLSEKNPGIVPGLFSSDNNSAWVCSHSQHTIVEPLIRLPAALQSELTIPASVRPVLPPQELLFLLLYRLLLCPIYSNILHGPI